MSTGVLIAIISGVVGLATGSAVTAWANWGIEKRRMKRQRRLGLLSLWRAGITANGVKFAGTSWYETLRPYLTDDMRDKLEAPRTVYVSSGDRPAVVSMLSSEVDRIERKWGLHP